MLARTILLVAATLALGGCGLGDSSPPPNPATTPSAEVPQSATPSPEVPQPATPSPEVPQPAAGCPDEPSPTGPACVTVTIRDFAFDPPVVTIPVSGRVVFVNEDGATHSIAWADGTPTSPGLARGDSTERSFQEVASGAFEYTCGIHGSSMSGRVVADASLPVS